jgi:hypothetical protein
MATLGLAFQRRTGAPAFGNRIASEPIPRSASMHRRCLGTLVPFLMARAALLGPCEEIAEAVDDAAAVAPVGRTLLSVAIVVERAPADAQDLGGFVDGEKRVVDIVCHGVLPHMPMRQCAAFYSSA